MKKKNRKPIFGILALLLVAVSMVPGLGVISLPAIILGLIGLFRESKLIAVLATLLAGVSMALSPTAWVMMTGLWLAVACQVMDCPGLVAESVQRTLGKPENQQAIAAIVQQAQSKPSYSASDQMPGGWVSVNYDDAPESLSNAVHANKLERFPGMASSPKLFSSFRTEPSHPAVLLLGVAEKPADQPLDTFIETYVASALRPEHPNLTVTPMEPVTIRNSCSETLKTAQLRHFTGGSHDGHEAVAYVDGGAYVQMVVIAAPNRAALMQTWPVFSDLVVEKLCFKVTPPSAAPPPPPGQP